MASVALLAGLAMTIAWVVHPPYPGWWGLFVLILVGFLLEVSSTRLRGGGAEGSISFVVHLSSFALFGPFWAASVATVSTMASQLAGKRPPTRIVFNTGQRVLSILLAGAIYATVGGRTPLGLFAQQPQTFEVVLHDLAAFLIAVIVYFVTNSVAVSGAVAISTGRSFRDVWKTNTLWVLGYDVAASTLALLVGWLYTIFDQPEGLTRLGFLAVFLPVIAIKHVYGKLNTLQDLYSELDSAYESLEQNVREQLAMMVKSIEARDPYTSGHSLRVSVLSKAIAIDFGLEENLVEEIENAALLHDVGKIHAEFAPLLQKEGKLTLQEWEIMKTHATKSAELVALFSRFRGSVEEAVRYHHERWDGQGYPEGVQAGEIPLGARIIMIADTIDAMTTDRPYRKALGFDVVVSELQKHRGTQFDPRLVDCTVNSVSVRRIAMHQDPPSSTMPLVPTRRSPPLRSYASFFAGRRLH